MLKVICIFIQLFAVNVYLAHSQPSFKGGSMALSNFLAEKIVYPEYSRQNCISGVVRVSFRVDNNGNVLDAKVQQGLGLDLDDEAVRVVKLTSGKWIVKPGEPLTSMVLPIRFDPDPTRCSLVTTCDINAAIAAYKVRQDLENVVTKYYTNKYLGKADTKEEPRIIALKKQLGFDEEFVNDVLEQADTKLRQGDKAGACEDWNFIRNIGSDRADKFIARYCK